MGFGRNVNNSQPSMLGELLEKLVSFKFLGVFIEKPLDFELHIDLVVANYFGTLFRV